jgi:hypothetical protein
MVTTSTGAASGVLLESGYILTAAHVIDSNGDGELNEDELRTEVIFPNIDFSCKADVILMSPYQEHGIDLAVLDPDITIPLKGTRIMSMGDYRSQLIGTPLVTIGMQLGQSPANVTDGRLISAHPDDLIHRNSANSYFGNSGGGVFIGNELAGIAVMVGYDELYTTVPIFEDRRMVGMVQIGYRIPLSNSSLHVSAPAIIDCLDAEGRSDILVSAPPECPYRAYFSVFLFNSMLVLWLVLIYQIMRRWMN